MGINNKNECTIESSFQVTSLFFSELGIDVKEMYHFFYSSIHVDSDIKYMQEKVLVVTDKECLKDVNTVVRRCHMLLIILQGHISKIWLIEFKYK